MSYYNRRNTWQPWQIILLTVLVCFGLFDMSPRPWLVNVVNASAETTAE
jgi:hypothetical protein